MLRSLFKHYMPIPSFNQFLLVCLITIHYLQTPRSLSSRLYGLENTHRLHWLRISWQYSLLTSGHSNQQTFRLLFYCVPHSSAASVRKNTTNLPVPTFLSPQSLLLPHQIEKKYTVLKCLLHCSYLTLFLSL